MAHEDQWRARERSAAPTGPAGHAPVEAIECGRAARPAMEADRKTDGDADGDDGPTHSSMHHVHRGEQRRDHHRHGQHDEDGDDHDGDARSASARSPRGRSLRGRSPSSRTKIDVLGNIEPAHRLHRQGDHAEGARGKSATIARDHQQSPEAAVEALGVARVGRSVPD